MGQVVQHSRKRSNIVPLEQDPRARNALKYKPEYCGIVKKMAKAGKFPEEWCQEFNISLSTMYNWANKYEDFDDACQIAWTALTAFWTGVTVEAARSGLKDTKVLLEILKKRFPDTWGFCARNTQSSFPTRWSTDPEHSKHNPEINLDEKSEEELIAELKMLRERHDL